MKRKHLYTVASQSNPTASATATTTTVNTNTKGKQNSGIHGNETSAGNCGQQRNKRHNSELQLRNK